jgi:hypothetical protein
MIIIKIVLKWVVSQFSVLLVKSQEVLSFERSYAANA